MFTRPFRPESFLSAVYGTEEFVDYCRQRHVPFEQTIAARLQKGDLRRWTAALAEIPREQHAQLELELATVNEMAGSDSVAHLIEAAGAANLPPDTVAIGAPLALWFFLHHPVLFHEVFLHHEIQEVESWHTAHAPPQSAIANLEWKAMTLTEELREFFRIREGTGHFCTVDTHRLTDAICFVTQIADRLHYLSVFTDEGKPARQRLRPALPIIFVYYPSDGTVLLKSHLRSRDRIADLFQRFGMAVLGSTVAYDAEAIDLERLKQPFHPLPDAEDMELIRVKTLHLRYPVHSGRRQLKLETLSSDATDAIDRLLHAHVAADSLAPLRVCHAELQVRLRVTGGRKNYLIRLWPNRCNLSQTALGDRFRACLRHWGLSHAR